MKRRIGVVTVGRSDYGIYYPLLRAIQSDSECELCLIVGGGHLSTVHGSTGVEIERDGFEIQARVPMLLSDDSPECVAMAMGMGVINFTNAYQKVRPDILLLLGDRFEMLAAAVSALPVRIPVAHIHGGELTYGAIDDAVRHAITKLSHLHFASAPEYGRRIEQMGEAADRVFVTGSPIVDTILRDEPLSNATLDAELQVSVRNALLITYHPVTLENEHTTERISMLLETLERFENELIFTYPNSDANNAAIIRHLEAFACTHSRAHIFVNLGRRRYHSLQRYVAAIVGNSSSGIIEAASFRLPVVNIGNRQLGRLRTPNVIDVAETSEAIECGIRRAISSEFRRQIETMKSPYGLGDASEKILHILKTVRLDGTLTKKSFCDLYGGGHSRNVPIAALDLGNAP